MWLKDVQLYVFCKTYRQENMRQNKCGAFEIYFVSEEGKARRSCTPMIPPTSVLIGDVGCRSNPVQGGFRTHKRVARVIRDKCDCYRQVTIYAGSTAGITPCFPLFAEVMRSDLAILSDVMMLQS